jgi:propanediol utilization protein
MAEAAGLSVPLYPAVRHARLTAEHVRALFGDARIAVVHTLAGGGDVTDRVVGVEGPAGRIDDVRVVLPVVARSTVALGPRDARRLGLPAQLPVSVDLAPGCTLHGPRGVVVLAAGAVAAERVVLPSPPPGQRAIDLSIGGDRPRTLRAVLVVPGEFGCAYVLDDELVLGARARLG